MSSRISCARFALLCRLSIKAGLVRSIDRDSVSGVIPPDHKVLVGAAKNLKWTLICRCEWSSHGVVSDENEFAISQVLRDI